MTQLALGLCRCQARLKKGAEAAHWCGVLHRSNSADLESLFLYTDALVRPSTSSQHLEPAPRASTSSQHPPHDPTRRPSSGDIGPPLPPPAYLRR